MMIVDVKPKISELTKEQAIKISRQAELHDVPFGPIPIEVFRKGAVIREAMAQYWEPQYKVLRCGKLKISDLSTVLFDVFPEGLMLQRRPGREFDFPVQLRILLTYPLRDVWEATVKIPANRFGEVFAIAHDMYRYVYDLDDGVSESEDRRCITDYTLSDLTFENIGFVLDSNWGIGTRKEVRLGDIARRYTYSTAPEQLREEQHRNKCPLIGTVVFLIGV